MTEIMRMSDVVRNPSSVKPETPEGVALELMEMIFFNEVSKPTREEILSTYAECLSTAKGEYRRTSAPKRKPISLLSEELAE